MAQGDPLYFRVSSYRGPLALWFMLFPTREAHATARWLMDSDDSPWRGLIVPDAMTTDGNGIPKRLVTAFTSSDGRSWRIRSRTPTLFNHRTWRIERVTRDMPDYDDLAGFLNAGARGG